MATFNLLTDPWIRVKRKDGTRDIIAPHQIAETDNPVTEFAGGLSNINGGYALFLIAIFQTYVAPKNEVEWCRLFVNKVTPEDLQESWKKGIPAFYMDGDGPRYMQIPHKERSSLTKKQKKKRGKDKPNQLPNLLNGEYSDKSVLKLNKTFFGLRNNNPDPIELGDFAALLTMTQTAGIGKQVGNMLSPLRGNGPVNCMIMQETLLDTILINVMSQKALEDLSNNSSSPSEFEFPWMKDAYNPKNLKHSGKKPSHPLYLYWHTPAKVVADVENGKVKDFYCGKYPKLGQKDGWKHPLTPFWISDEGGNCQTFNSEMSCSEWARFRYGAEESDSNPIPIVELYQQRRKRNGFAGILPEDLQVWVFGTVANVSKNVENVDLMFPIMSTEPEIEKDMAFMTRIMVSHANEMSDEVLRRFRDCCYENSTKWYKLRNQFDIWGMLEDALYRELALLRNELLSGTPKKEAMQNVSMRWHEEVSFLCQTFFDEKTGILAMSPSTFQVKKIGNKTTNAYVEKKWLRITMANAKKALNEQFNV